ncbi:MAG: copper-binding protein, partial [Thaumarchaeota archaeon]|nr:copper-binding protein [Nitrososphaerota archaeon]
MEFNKTRDSLVILLTSSDNGDLTMTIPRTLLDSKQHIQPYQFTVLVDNYPVRYTQTVSSYYNTLTIPFSHGSGKIEIMVPE